MTLHNEQDAVRQAVEAGDWVQNDLGLVRGTSNKRIVSGWTVEFMGDSRGTKVEVWTTVQDGELRVGEFFLAEILSTPAFWQALGRAQGWKSGCNICKEPHFTGMHHASDEEAYECENPRQHMTAGHRDPWLNHALRYFETRLLNGDMKAYWENLP